MRTNRALLADMDPKCFQKLSDDSIWMLVLFFRFFVANFVPKGESNSIELGLISASGPSLNLEEMLFTVYQGLRSFLIF